MAAAFDIWISNANMGKIIGKLSMGIRVALRPALAAIADMRVKHIEKLLAPSATAPKNKGSLRIGLPINSEKTPTPMAANNNSKKMLYIILAKITACGLAMV